MPFVSSNERKNQQVNSQTESQIKKKPIHGIITIATKDQKQKFETEMIK